MSDTDKRLPMDCSTCRALVDITSTRAPDEPSNHYCGNMIADCTYVLNVQRPPCKGRHWRKKN